MRVVYQIEGVTQIDDERVLSLPGEDAPGHAAARNADVIDICVGIGGVVGDRLLPDIGDRLYKSVSAGVGIDNRLRPTAATDRKRIALDDVQVRRVVRADGPFIDKGDRNEDAADRDREVFPIIIEAELKRDVGYPVPGVVNVDLIDGILIELVVVRAAARVFPGL